MTSHRCPYCKQTFVPSRYHPEQTVCSSAACQRRRKADYHRRKIQDDPIYRTQCRDSQRQWREEHPEYMRTYRQSQTRSNKTRRTHGCNPSLIQLLHHVKNNPAVDLKSCPASVFLICSNERVKNILVEADLILIKQLSKA
jgi:hypothetical protein